MGDESKTRAFWEEGLAEAERAARAVSAQKVIAELPSETYRRDYDLFNVRLYENNPNTTLYTFAGKYYAEAAALPLPPQESSTNNKAKAAIDTLAAQVFSTDQRARVYTVDGDYKQKRRARKMQNFADGLAWELKLHKLRKRAGLDAAILESGVGCLQFYRDGNRVAVQRGLATEYSIDPMDGMVDGQPRTLYRRRPIPRDTVLSWDDSYSAETLEAIKKANRVAVGGAPADHIEVFEAWHLPTTATSKDGWHVLALEDGTPIAVEPYTKTFHETVFFALEGRFTTSWGLGLMSQVRKLQLRINANDYRIERAQRLFHAAHIYVDRAAKMKKSQMTNEIGTIWEGSSPNPPQQIVFQAASPELYAQIERDGNRIFENLGISLSASQAQTDSGLNASAAAKREDKATSGERNAVRQQAWEDFHLDCMRAGMSIVRDIVLDSEGGGYRVAMPGKRGLTVTDWRDVKMDEADYILQVKAASPIPTEPAGLVALGQQMVDLGAWSPQKLAGYMQDLDADSRINRAASQERQLESMFENLLYEDRAAAVPDEFTNYQMAIEIGTEYLAQGQEDGCPEKHVERVRRYLKRCKAMAKAALATMQPPPGAAPAPAAPQPVG